MPNRTPIQRRIHAEAVKKVAEQFLGMKNFSVRSLSMAALFFIGAGWLPDGFSNLLFSGNRTYGLIQLAVSAAIFAGFGLALRLKLREAHQVRVLATVSPSARVLVIFLSPLHPDQQSGIEQALRNGEDLSPDLLTKTPWEMSWLAVSHHAERLENLYVLTSSGAGGTAQLFGLFREVMSRLFPALSIATLADGGIDFEDIAAVHQRVDDLYDRLNEDNSYGHKDIMVDVTGGQKTNSIAAAMTTLSAGRHFQYVSTRSMHNVMSYDLVIDRDG